MAFITAIGGLEAIKWLVRLVTYRKMDARKEEASVSCIEEENRRRKVDWLEERLEPVSYTHLDVYKRQVQALTVYLLKL